MVRNDDESGRRMKGRGGVKGRGDVRGKRSRKGDRREGN
jgi:hypothetical protein